MKKTVLVVIAIWLILMGIIMFPVWSKEVTLIGIVPSGSLTEKQKEYLSYEKDTQPVQVMKKDGTFDTAFIPSTILAGVSFPVKAEKKSSTCGCNVSYKIK